MKNSKNYFILILLLVFTVIGFGSWTIIESENSNEHVKEVNVNSVIELEILLTELKNHNPAPSEQEINEWLSSKTDALASCGSWKIYAKRLCTCHRQGYDYDEFIYRRWCTANGAPAGGYWQYTGWSCGYLWRHCE